ncbi:MAG TPA: hypothetical protein PKM84_01375 [Candidatus Pacearchaeota archaeon]|nr:hypothetical protein [Candidatus Pacearchaeota archaeon]
MAKDAKGMRGMRSRTQRGRLRVKRADTHISTIEKKYERNFKVRKDMQLKTLLGKKKDKSLNDLITNQ